METTAAIEEAFICGDWTTVLQQSREKLLEHVAAAEARDGTMTQTEEALVSMYLQSVFELAKHDEVETAVMLMQSLTPLPFHISVQWIKFLIAMDNRSVALELLNESLERCSTELASAEDTSDCQSRYVQLTELLVFHVLSPNESPKVVRDYISKDAVLDEATKQRILDAAHAALPSRPQDVALTQAIAPQTEHTTGSTPVSSTQASSVRGDALKAAARGNGGVDNDPSGDLVSIGGSALAVAALAIGVYRYRDTLRETVAEIGPAVSKGIADAKYALFES